MIDTMPLKENKVLRQMSLGRWLKPFVLIALSCGFAFYIYSATNTTTSSQGSTVQIPVHFFPFARKPLIHAEIEEKKRTLMLDTGSSHFLDLNDDTLSTLKDLTFIRTSKYFNLKGTTFEVRAFQAPPFKIHKDLTTKGAEVYSESLEFLNSTSIKPTKSITNKIRRKLRLAWIDGRLGSPFLSAVCALFDFHHSVLYLGKDVAALESEGFFHADEYTKTPLFPSRAGPVLHINTKLGERRFLLDTGATHCMIREEDCRNKDLINLDLSIEKVDLGRWTFFTYPLASELQDEIDGILGIDFFKAHAICLDVKNQTAYIKKTHRHVSMISSHFLAKEDR